MFNLLLLGGLIVFVFGILFSPKNKMPTSKKRLYFFSLVATIIFSIIPSVGYYVNSDGYTVFGFPAEGFVHYGGWDIGFSTFGFVFNFILFYWSFKLLRYLWSTMTIRMKRDLDDTT